MTHTSPVVDPEEIDTGSVELKDPFGLGAFFGSEPPAAPSDLTATAEDSSFEIVLVWTDNSSDEIGFKIEYRKDGDDTFAQMAKVADDITTYTTSELERETHYEFRVRAYSDAADSDYSDEASATTTDERFSWCFIGLLDED